MFRVDADYYSAEPTLLVAVGEVELHLVAFDGSANNPPRLLLHQGEEEKGRGMQCETHFSHCEPALLISTETKNMRVVKQRDLVLELAFRGLSSQRCRFSPAL